MLPDGRIITLFQIDKSDDSTIYSIIINTYKNEQGALISRVNPINGKLEKTLDHPDNEYLCSWR